MIIYLKLVILGIIVATVSTLMYILKLKTKLGKLSFWKRQIIFGVVFGALSVMGTEFGVSVNGAIANVRDAGPLCAGLLFGAPAGIIAGLIGGVERFLAAYWGRGFYTQWACSISTILAGLFGAFLRKYINDNKSASPLFGLVAAAVMEVVHLLFIFFLRFNDSQTAIEIVEVITLPMVFGNMVAVGLACLAVWLVDVKLGLYKREKTISKQIQKWLLLVIVLCYVATTIFVYSIETKTANLEASSLLEIGLNDSSADLPYAIADAGSTQDGVNQVLSNRRIGEGGYFVSFDKNYQSLYNGDKLANPKDYVSRYQPKEIIEAKLDGDKYFMMYIAENDCYIFAFLSEDEAYATRNAALYINSFMNIVVFAITFILIYYLVKKIVVDNIYNVNGKLRTITKGNLNVKVDIGDTIEFQELSSDINTTVDALKGYIDEAAARLDKELALAHSIQTSVLPSVFPPFPQVKKYDVYASMIPAKEVGGDFYDFYMIGDNKIAFLIADVSGKGIPAAMFMMQAKTMIKNLAESGYNVEEIFTIANKKLCENNDAEMFVTSWMGILDIESGIIEFANAGHNPPLLYRDGKIFDYFKTKSGFVLAGLDNSVYKKYTLKLEAGDRLFLYTDGVTEAINDVKDLYGEERLRDFMNSHYYENNADLLNNIKADIDLFANGAEQFDDITMLIIDAKKEEKDFVYKDFEASVEVFPLVSNYITSKLEENEASVKAINQIEIACEEIFVNIAHYAYDGARGSARIGIKVDHDTAFIRFIDKGKAFNPLSKDDPDVQASVSDRSIGGLGIYMVKQMMDYVEYEYVDGQNVLTIVKKIK